MKHTIYTKNEQDKYPLAPSDRALVKRAITAALYGGGGGIRELCG